MSIVAKRLVGQTETDLQAGPAAIPLPMGSAWMKAGVYSYAGKSYDCTEEGLYIFWNDDNGTAQNRIVLKDFAGGADLYKVISGVCWNHVHGTDHNGWEYQLMSNSGMARRWSAQCGYIVGLLVWALPQFGFTARSRNPRTLEPTNGYDDGHVVLETLHDGAWRMWDLSSGIWFRDAAGKHLSTAEVAAAVNAGGDLPDIKSLCPLWRFDSDAVGGIDLSIYGFMRHRTPELRERWIRRIYQSV